jgi:adenosylhomocysteine nucleosidase
MLGIVVSLPWELKTLTRQTVGIGTCRRISDDTLIALSGIGAERAHAAGELLLSQGATALLSWGCAAALDDFLKPGTVMLPERLISPNGEAFPVSYEWHRRLHQTLSGKYSVRTDALLESEAIVNTADAKRALAERTQAAATDMESGAQARLARARRMPFVVVRVIVDTASAQIPENVMRALDSSGDVNIRSCLVRAILCPADGIAMIKLGMQFKVARKTLKQASALVLDASRIHLDCLSTSSAPAARL